MANIIDSSMRNSVLIHIQENSEADNNLAFDNDSVLLSHIKGSKLAYFSFLLRV